MLLNSCFALLMTPLALCDTVGHWLRIPRRPLTAPFGPSVTSSHPVQVRTGMDEGERIERRVDNWTTGLAGPMKVSRLLGVQWR